MSKKGKGNKQILEGINYSLEVVKKIKAHEEFTIDEKEEILNKFVGMSKDNNSYFTPVPICNFIKQLLQIDSGKIADFSSGIGNMVIPFIKEYGKLNDEITFDLYELDENNSLAASKAWEDYEQVNTYSNYNTIERHAEIPDDSYDIVIGNPPFSGSIKYYTEWNHNKNGTAKNNNIADAFVDLSVRKVKKGGYIGLVLPLGHLFKSHGTAKLREWLHDNVALKGIFPLDSGTFSDAGVVGTSVGTVLIVWQKGVSQKEIFLGELTDKDDLISEMDSMAKQFQVFTEGDYNIRYGSNSLKGIHGIMEKNLKPWECDAV